MRGEQLHPAFPLVHPCQGMSEPDSDRRPGHLVEGGRVLGGRGVRTIIKQWPCPPPGTLYTAAQPPWPATSGTSASTAGPSNASTPSQANTFPWSLAGLMRGVATRMGGAQLPAPSPSSRGWSGTLVVKETPVGIRCSSSDQSGESP